MEQVDEIKKIVSNAIEMPAIPTVMVKALNMIGDPNITLANLGKIVAIDQSLSTYILRMSNSAFYRARQEIKTLPMAMSRIGLKNLKNIIIAAASKGMFKTIGPKEQRLWDHSVAVSIASRLLSQKITFIDEEEAFLAGLLHDIGKTILNNNDPAKYDAVMSRVDAGKRFDEAEKEVYNFTHAQIGSVLINKWELPVYLENVILCHHQTYIEPELGANTLRMTSLIQLADLIAITLGIGYAAIPQGVDLFQSKALETLNLTPDTAKAVSEETIKTFNENKEFFN